MPHELKLSPTAHKLIRRASNCVHLPEHLKFVEYALKQAQQKRDDAGFGGAMHDGGASDIEHALTSWIDGLQGRTPSCYPLFELHKQFTVEADPDYAKYLELKKRFG